MTVVKLKKLLKDRGIKSSGKKQELIDRLVASKQTYADLATNFLDPSCS